MSIQWHPKQFDSVMAIPCHICYLLHLNILHGTNDLITMQQNIVGQKAWQFADSDYKYLRDVPLFNLKFTEAKVATTDLWNGNPPVRF